jgi:hypothetical protein
MVDSGFDGTAGRAIRRGACENDGLENAGIRELESCQGVQLPDAAGIVARRDCPWLEMLSVIPLFQVTGFWLRLRA